MTRRLLVVALLPLLLVGFQPAAKTLTVAVAQEPDRLFNPQTVSGRLAANLVFDPLIGLDDHMQPYPVLAAQLPSLDNGLIQTSGSRVIVTMPLRDGVTWSDGEPFTADDVVYTWQLMLNPESGFDTTVEEKIATVDKLDDLTVRFTYVSPDPRAFFGLPDTPAIYPRHVLRQLVGDDPRRSREVANVSSSTFARSPVGTGPYVLVGWDPGSSLVFTARRAALPQRLGPPNVDTLALRVTPDKNDALQNPDVQLLAQDELDATDAPALDSLAGVQPFYTGGRALEQITFNLDNPILADPTVRRAIAFGLDRPALNAAVLAGKAELPLSLVPGWSWAANPSAPAYPHDPALAEQVLDRAGWTRSAADGVRQKNGQRLSFRYWMPPASFRAMLSARIKDQLAQIGIELRIDVIPSSVLFDTRPSAPEALVARQFDLVEFAWVHGYDPGADQVYTLHSMSVPSRANGYQGGNYGNYRSSGSDELLSQAERSVDPAFRRATLGELQAIWQADLPALPLLVRPIVTAVRQGVTNVRPTPAPAGETWNVEQWDVTVP
jgi:peptide/nickel transport system substrate-binding protein